MRVNLVTLLIFACLVGLLSGCFGLNKERLYEYRPVLIEKKVEVLVPCTAVATRPPNPVYPSDAGDPEARITWQSSMIAHLEGFIRNLSGAATSCGVTVNGD